MDYAAVLKTHRKKPLASPEDLSHPLAYDQDEIIKIIPHREPFLLVDRLLGLDLGQGVILASRKIAETDPVFQGHFPDFPVYPGSLQLEMIGQVGLCLYYFEKHRRTDISDQAQPVPVRATKILGAHFLEPVPPGAEVTVAVKKLEQEAYLGTVVGQVISGKTVCSVSISEVCFLE